MKNNEEVQFAWRLWTMLIRLEDVVWEHYADEFIELNMDKDFKEYPKQPQDDDIPF